MNGNNAHAAVDTNKCVLFIRGRAVPALLNQRIFSSMDTVCSRSRKGDLINITHSYTITIINNDCRMFIMDGADEHAIDGTFEDVPAAVEEATLRIRNDLSRSYIIVDEEHGDLFDHVDVFVNLSRQSGSTR
jgi:hypothetical protein